MEIIIVRHADPDYSIDSLTEKGVREAELLAERLSKDEYTAFYQSPMGRAKKTASYTMEKLGAKAETLDWLCEFKGSIIKDGQEGPCWDRLPSTWTEEDIYYTKDWYNGKLFDGTNVKAEHIKVCEGVDKLLEKHGYKHVGRHFEVVNGNHDRIVLFCHFGVESVILSHIFGISPMIIWHNTAGLTSSVSVLATEEREKGIAIFRMNRFSDLSHLYSGNEPPSFQCRFCECFEDNTRH